jgi:hypothetical protein
MPLPPNAPNTDAVASAIVAYTQALTFAGGGAVYSRVQKGEIKDVVNLVAGSAQACLEVYANLDDSQRYAFGGRIRDEQTWFLLSLVNLDNAQTAETLIYNVRDALVQPFQTHATLGNAGSVFHSELKQGTGKFLKIMRNGEWLRAHLVELMSRSEWQVISPPGITA